MSAAVDRLLEISLYATVITGCIALFRLAFSKRLSPRLQYLLWTILIARLLLPVTIESGFHLPALLPERPAAVVGADAPAGGITPDMPALETAADNTAAAPLGPAALPAQAEARQARPWREIVFIVWAAGAFVSLGCTLLMRLRFLRRLRRTQTADSPVAALMLAGCREALGVKGRIELVTTTRDLSPALTFIGGRNMLIMPAGLTDRRALRYALLHELSHYRRGDQYMLLLLSLLRAVYWFNPVLYYAFSEMRADMETACDACVLAVIEPEEKRDYLMTLLTLFSRQTQPSLGFAQVQTRRLAKKRMKGAFMKRKINPPTGVAALLLALTLLVGCFTTACQKGGTVPAGADSLVSPGNAAPATPGNASAEILNNDIVEVRDLSDYSAVYQVVYRGPATDYSATQEPRGAVVSPTEAARNLLELMARVFDGQLGGGAVNVYFSNSEAHEMEKYQLYVGGVGYDDAYFHGLCDASTGEVLSVDDLRAHSEDIENPEDFSFDGYDMEEIKESAMANARALVEGRLAKDRTILEDSYVDGVQGTFTKEEPIVSEVYLHMDGGPCYSLGVYYPSMRIGHVHIYPLGWVYCMSGTFHTEYLDDWALEALGLPVPAPMETTVPGAVSEPVPTPKTPAGPAGSAMGAEVSDEIYTMIAQTAEAMIGDEFLAADFGLAAAPDFSNFGEICRVWIHDLLFDTMSLSLAETGAGTGLSSLDDPQLKPGMCLSWRIDGIDYAGVSLGGGQVAVLHKGEPYKLRQLDLAPFAEGGSLTELCLIRLYEAA